MSLSKQSHRINIFEIPHILESIYFNLEKVDINRCRLVCRGWASLSEPYFWRNTKLQLIRKRPSTKIILKNSHWIRRLDIETMHASRLLGVARKSLTNLRELHFSYSYDPDYESRKPKLTQEAIDAELYCCENCGDPSCTFVAALEFVALNPKLHTLQIYVFYDGGRFIDEDLYRNFASHPTLTKLILMDDKHELFTTFPVSAVLRNCPPSLRELRIFCCSLSCSDDSNMKKELELEELFPWKRFESLEILSIDIGSQGIGRGSEPWIHLPILKNSPRLKEFKAIDFENGDKILETASTFCPKLESIDLSSRVPCDIHESDILRMILAYPTGFKTLRLHGVCRLHGQFIPALLQTSAKTLEYLCLQGAYGRIDISRRSIFRVLNECLRLKEFSLPISGARSHIGLSLDELLRTRYASHQLEVLKIPLIDPVEQLDVEDYIMMSERGRYEIVAAKRLELFRRVKAHAKKIKPRFHFPCFSETYSIPLGAGLELMGHELTEYQIWEMDLGRSKDYWNNSDEEDEDDDDDEEDDGEDEATDMSF